MISSQWKLPSFVAGSILCAGAVLLTLMLVANSANASDRSSRVTLSAAVAYSDETQAIDYLPQAVDTVTVEQGTGTSHQFTLLDSVSGLASFFEATIQSASATVNWSSYGNLPKLQLEKPGTVYVRWKLSAAGETDVRLMDMDLTVSDLDVERNEGIIVEKKSIVGYSVAPDSIILVSENNQGQLLFTATADDDRQSGSGAVTLHIRRQMELVLGYRAGENQYPVDGVNNSRAGFRHDFSATPDLDYVAVHDQTEVQSEPEALLVVEANPDVEPELPALDENGIAAPDKPEAADDDVAQVEGDNEELTPIAGSPLSDDPQGGKNETDLLLTVADSSIEQAAIEAGDDNDNDGLTNLQEQQLGTDPDVFDTDGDGVSDGEEVFVLHTDPFAPPVVPEIIPEVVLPDSDGDGIADKLETMADHDGDGIPNQFDLDSDNDGIADVVESGMRDANGNGQVDFVDTPLISEAAFLPDYDEDGLANMFDLDSDQDGFSDLVESNGTDLDENGRVDAQIDENGDGWSDQFMRTVFLPVDEDRDGSADYLDPVLTAVPAPQDGLLADPIIQNDAALIDAPTLQTGTGTLSGGGCVLNRAIATVESIDWSLPLLITIAIFGLGRNKRLIQS